jgi:hypothetical protein
MAAIYCLIGLGVLSIGASSSGEMVDLAVFGGGAGTAFLVTAALLAFTDWRPLWALLLAFQVFVYVIYVTASGVREPPFELWGITLRILQLPLIAALIYLTVKPATRHDVVGEGGLR